MPQATVHQPTKGKDLIVCQTLVRMSIEEGALDAHTVCEQDLRIQTGAMECPHG